MAKLLSPNEANYLPFMIGVKVRTVQEGRNEWSVLYGVH